MHLAGEAFKGQFKALIESILRRSLAEQSAGDPGVLEASVRRCDDRIVVSLHWREPRVSRGVSNATSEAPQLIYHGVHRDICERDVVVIVTRDAVRPSVCALRPS